MHINEQFIQNLKNMDAIVKQEIKNGKKWKYNNSNQEHTFAKARSKNNRVVNCVLGVRWALRGLVPDSALAWYGSTGKIQWGNPSAEKRAKKYFDIIRVGNKTVKQCVKEGLLCDGDILTYVSMTHTNCYIGGNSSFDTGHAYCIGQTFRKWIGSLSCKGYKVAYIFRLKDRAHYRVQAGAYSDINEYNKQIAFLASKGYKNPVTIEEDGMKKIQLGYYDGKTNAEKFVAKLKKKGINAFVKEIV